MNERMNASPRRFGGFAHLCLCHPHRWHGLALMMLLLSVLIRQNVQLNMQNSLAPWHPSQTSNFKDPF